MRWVGVSWKKNTQVFFVGEEGGVLRVGSAF